MMKGTKGTGDPTIIASNVYRHEYIQFCNISFSEAVYVGELEFGLVCLPF